MEYLFWYTSMDRNSTGLKAHFFRSETGREPVREWLASLSRPDKQLIGIEIRTIQIGWPLGMPVVRKLEKGLWEARISLANQIARVIFTANEDGMILLHGFIKKSQKTPAPDLATARKRKAATERQKQ